ncbi:MAG: GNAT family N-acetyltransferase [Planctomycetaceae bacterium]|nr:GNAT family N-acetyltransferase [Planctomycetaceae bacterium]
MSIPIRLRQYRSDDVDAVADAVLESQAELSIWMPWCHPDYGRQDAAAWVASRPDAWQRNEEKSFLVVAADDQLLGGCGIHRINLQNGVGELGYWVRSSATRRGVATEATRLACAWAFEVAGLHRIEILASVENVASQRVAEKAGGVREGILRERLLLHGRRHDCVLYSIVRR